MHKDWFSNTQLINLHFIYNYTWLFKKYDYRKKISIFIHDKIVIF
jgi:hypothetical protein